MLRQTLDTLKKAADKYGYKIHYAVKANANPEILKIICSYGFGADCVSGNEVLKSIRKKVVRPGEMQVVELAPNQIESAGGDITVSIQLPQEVAE